MSSVVDDMPTLTAEYELGRQPEQERDVAVEAALKEEEETLAEAEAAGEALRRSRR